MLTCSCLSAAWVESCENRPEDGCQQLLASDWMKKLISLIDEESDDEDSDSQSEAEDSASDD